MDRSINPFHPTRHYAHGKSTDTNKFDPNVQLINRTVNDDIVPVRDNTALNHKAKMHSLELKKAEQGLDTQARILKKDAVMLAAVHTPSLPQQQQQDLHTPSDNDADNDPNTLDAGHTPGKPLSTKAKVARLARKNQRRADQENTTITSQIQENETTDISSNVEGDRERLSTHTPLGRRTSSVSLALGFDPDDIHKVQQNQAKRDQTHDRY